MNIRKNLFLALTSGLLLGLPWSASSLFFAIFIAWGPLLLLEEEVRIHHHANAYAIFNYAFISFLLWNIIGTWWIMQAQVVGAVLIPGAKAPKLVSREMLKTMKPGSVLVDVAIDQGGCFETSKPTTHADPIYVVDGIVHYCVANMPGAVPRTSTFALNNATLPFTLALAIQGAEMALAADPHLLAGLNVYRGQVTYRAVSESTGLPFTDPSTVLRA